MAAHHRQECEQTHWNRVLANVILATRKKFFFAVYSNEGANRFSCLFSSINQHPLVPINTPATTQNLF